MSRARAQKEPFWATSISNMKPGCQRIVRGLHALFQRSSSLAPYLWMGSGWRTGSVEHNSGRAIDIIVTATTGRRPNASEHAAALLLIKWLQVNASELGIQHILYSTDGKNRTQSWNSVRKTWNNLKDRGSVSGNHIDHIHVYFRVGADWPQRFNLVSIGGTVPKPSPGLPGTGVNDKKEEDIMATKGDLRELLGEVLPGLVEASVIKVIENKNRYTEYGDEHGDGRSTRSPVDVLYSGQNHAVSANQNSVALLKRVGALEAQLTGLGKALETVSGGKLDIDAVVAATKAAIDESNQELSESLGAQLEDQEAALLQAVEAALEGSSTVDPTTFAHEVFRAFRDLLGKVDE